MKNKNIQQLQKVYDNLTGGALKYFNEHSAEDNLLLFMTLLAYLRDYKILTAAETNTDDETLDNAMSSLLTAINEYASYFQLSQVLENTSGVTDNTAALVEEKDAHYRKMWEAISHGFGDWFE